MSKKSKSPKAPRLYDLASESMRDVDQAWADQFAFHQHLFFVYVRAQMALIEALTFIPLDGPYSNPTKLLQLASGLASIPNDDYKKFAAALLKSCSPK